MKILHFDISLPFVLNEPIVACIGYFDGLHMGHQKLINKTIEYANINHLKSCLITFNPDPNDVLKNIKHQHLQSFNNRLEMIAEFNLDYCIILNFTNEMAKLNHEHFYSKVLSYLNIRHLICGFDFRYGYKGLGNFETLKTYICDDFSVEKIDSVNYLQSKISTSRIKDALNNGDIILVNSMLGYRYFIDGIVEKGKQIGRLIDFPTANINIDDEVYLLREGVYIGEVLYKDIYYKCMINIGYNPTVANDNPKTIEVHILNFEKDIYGEKLRVFFDNKIRDEIKFTSLNELNNQLKKDKEMVIKYYGK